MAKIKQKNNSNKLRKIKIIELKCIESACFFLRKNDFQL